MGPSHQFHGQSLKLNDYIPERKEFAGTLRDQHEMREINAFSVGHVSQQNTVLAPTIHHRLFTFKPRKSLSRITFITVLNRKITKNQVFADSINFDDQFISITGVIGTAKTTFIINMVRFF
jgi:hypothetical protein